MEIPAIAVSDEAMKNFDKFVTELIEKAHALTGERRYFYQDAEYVENEMDGDEMVYMRAWQGDGFFIICGYMDDTWKDNYLVYFWANDPKLKFNGIGVGSSFPEMKSAFEDILYDSSDDSCNAMWDGVSIAFALEDNRVKAFRLATESSITTKMNRYVEAYEQSIVAQTDSANEEERASSVQNQNSNSKNQHDSYREDGVFVMDGTRKEKSFTGNVYVAPSKFITSHFIQFVNILNPDRVSFGCKIKIVTNKNFMGDYETYVIDADGKPGGTVYNVVDAVVID
jgi:hypothetical protein